MPVVVIDDVVVDREVVRVVVGVEAVSATPKRSYHTARAKRVTQPQFVTEEKEAG